MQGNLRGSLSVCWLFDVIRWPSGSGSLIKQHALRGVAPARICASGPRFFNPPAPPQRPSALPKPSLSPLSFVIFFLSCAIFRSPLYILRAPLGHSQNTVTLCALTPPCTVDLLCTELLRTFHSENGLCSLV